MEVRVGGSRGIGSVPRRPAGHCIFTSRDYELEQLKVERVRVFMPRCAVRVSCGCLIGLTVTRFFSFAAYRCQRVFHS